MQRARFPFSLFVALLAVLGAPASVSARPSEPGDAPVIRDKVTRAEAFFRYGNKVYAENNWADAEKAFLAAWYINPTYDVAANLGHAQFKLGKYRDAAESLSFALRTWPLIGKPEPRKLAAEKLAQARTFIAALTIEMKAERASIYVDGQLVGQSPLDHEVFVEPGDHKVQVHHEVEGDEMLLVKAERNTAQNVKMSIGGEPRPRPVATSAPAAASEPPLPPPSMLAPPQRSTALLVAGLGVAAVGFGLGLGGLTASNNNVSTFDALRGPLVASGGTSACTAPANADACSQLRSASSASATYRGLAIVGFSMAGTATIGTAIYALLHPLPKTPERMNGAAFVGPGVGGVVVTGSF